MGSPSDYVSCHLLLILEIPNIPLPLSLPPSHTHTRTRTLLQVLGNLGAADIDSRLEEQLIDGILYAFQEQTNEVRERETSPGKLAGKL